MTIINKILIVLDVYNDFRDDPNHQPLEIKKAIALAADPANTTLYLVGCGFEEYLHDAYAKFTTDAPALRKQFTEQMQQRLQSFAEPLIAQGFTVDCRIHWSYPRYEKIAKEASTLGVDLVVQHVNAQQAHERHNLSHDSWQLVKTCKQPLLLIKDREWAQPPLLLAAVDPLHRHFKPKGLDQAILDTALSASKSVSGSVHIVHAHAEATLLSSGGDAVKGAHQKALKKLLAPYDIASENVHLVEDTPLNAILQTHNSLPADIVLLGALSRSRLAEAIIGNTAERVLDYVKSDLYIIRPL